MKKFSTAIIVSLVALTMLYAPASSEEQTKKDPIGFCAAHYSDISYNDCLDLNLFAQAQLKKLTSLNIPAVTNVVKICIDKYADPDYKLHDAPKTLACAVQILEGMTDIKDLMTHNL